MTSSLDVVNQNYMSNNSNSTNSEILSDHFGQHQQGLNEEMILYGLILSDLTRKIGLWMNPILIFVGLLANFLVILVFSRHELRKLSISIHTIALALSDMCLLMIPILLSSLREYDPELFRHVTVSWCKLHGYLDISFCSWSAWNIVALSNDRWTAICRPPRIYSREANKKALMIVFIIPILSLVLFSWYPILIETKNNVLDISAFHIDQTSTTRNMFKEAFTNFSSSVIAQETTTPMSTTPMNLTTQPYCEPKDTLLFFIAGSFSIMIAYFLPFVLISFYNVRIIKTLNARIQKRKEYFSGTLHFKYFNSNLEIVDVKIPANKTKNNNNNNNNHSRSQSTSSQASRSPNRSRCSITTNASISQPANNNPQSSSQFYLRAQRRSSTTSITQRLSWKASSKRLNSSGTLKVVENEEGIFTSMNSKRVSISCPERSSKSKIRIASRLTGKSQSRLKSNSILSALDGNGLHLSSNAALLRAREYLNQYQRLNNDRSINIMLITVSLAFLLLTFPYQIIWIVEKIFIEILNTKESGLPDSDVFKKTEILTFKIITTALKDLCLVVRNLNFSINFFLYSTMSNLFRRELNILFQRIGFYNFILFKNSITGSTQASDIRKLSRSQKQSSLRTTELSEIKKNKKLSAKNESAIYFDKKNQTVSTVSFNR